MNAPQQYVKRQFYPNGCHKKKDYICEKVVEEGFEPPHNLTMLQIARAIGQFPLSIKRIHELPK